MRRVVVCGSTLGRIRIHRFFSLLIFVGQTWHWYRERGIALRQRPLFLRNVDCLVGSIGQAYQETRANAGVGFVIYNDDY